MGMLCCKTTFTKTNGHFYLNVLLLLPALFRVLYSAPMIDKSSTRVILYAPLLLHETEGDWYKGYHLCYSKSLFYQIMRGQLCTITCTYKISHKNFLCNQISASCSFNENFENNQCNKQKSKITIV